MFPPFPFSLATTAGFQVNRGRVTLCCLLCCGMYAIIAPCPRTKRQSNGDLGLGSSCTLWYARMHPTRTAVECNIPKTFYVLVAGIKL